jgi:uncharacterized membrane protein
MKSKYGSLTIIGLAMCSMWGVAFAAPQYRAIDVGLLPGMTYTKPAHFNDEGVVIGQSGTEGRPPRSFVWTRETGMTPVGALIQYAINDTQVVGYRTRTGAIGYTVASRNKKPIYFLENTWAERAYYIAQINSTGQILGSSFEEAGSDAYTSPWLWSPESGLTEILPRRDAIDYYPAKMNNVGQIVGRANSLCTEHAFIYDYNTKNTTFLGPGFLPGRLPDRCTIRNAAKAINDAGQVVGYGNLPQDKEVVLPFIWTAADGIQPLSGLNDPRMTELIPNSINEAGQVVGSWVLDDLPPRYYYFYWDKDSGAVDLQSLLDPTDPLTSKITLYASGHYSVNNNTLKINSRGEILVTGYYTAQSPSSPNRAFVLVPTESSAAARASH